jgi:hypothetical protein
MTLYLVLDFIGAEEAQLSFNERVFAFLLAVILEGVRYA